MTNVFLVSSGGQREGDYQIHGIFSTMGKAMEVMAQLDSKGVAAWVQNYEIDKPFE